MKSVLIFLCVVVAAMAHLPPDQKEFLRQVHLTCQADPKTFCDENILRKLSDNKDNHQAQIHMMCMAVKAGLQHANGGLNRSFIRSRIALVTHEEPSRVDGFVQKCAVVENTPEKTAISLWLCFIKNDITYYHVL